METIMEIIYETRNEVDVEITVYYICSSCFDSQIIQSAELLVLPDMMMDQAKDDQITWIVKDNSKKCDAIDPVTPIECYCK
jgi:hypothetical protein